MAVKKKPKPKPYNPLIQPMRTQAEILAEARRRAHADTMKAAALLPSDQVVKQAGESLISSLRSTIDPYSKIVEQAGASYADATAGAKAGQSSVMAQLGAPAGTAAPADTRGGLLGAMAANNLSGMSGALIGAQQAIPAKITQNAGKRAAVMAGEEAAFEAYKQAGYDDALRIAAARQNAELSQATLGANIQDKNIDNAADQQRISIAQQNADTARQRLEDAKARTKDPALQKGLDKAAAAINAVLHKRGKGKRTVSGTYYFEIPSIIPGQKPKSVSIVAKNGNEARAAFIKKLNAAKSAGTIGNYLYDPTKAASYFTKMDKNQEDYLLPANRSAALNEARRILVAAGYSDSQALAEARRLLGPAPKKKTSKPKPDRLNAGH